MAVNLKGRDLLSLGEFSFEAIMQILEYAGTLKLKHLAGEEHRLLAGKTIAMIFQKPSLRTRVSFEIGANHLGAHAVYLAPGDIKLGEREGVADIAKVLSRYADCIIARVFAHQTVLDLAEFASVPVVNALCDTYHPCQVLADLLTIREKKGEFEGLKLAFVGDGNNMVNTLMLGCGAVGMDVSVATPQDYEPNPGIVERARERAAARGAEITITNDPKEAVKDADVVYTDVWTGMGQEDEYEKRKVDFAGYGVDADLMSYASPEATVLHCLPAHYGEEITFELVHEDPRSAVFDQAENRLHAQKAVLALLI
ncbi:MAG: ornithine carbamoyltransferase [Candidatus Coatesbacteria bacterium]|nr:ornithine carbamoyltransferase [Candidatus Coatesbacteria bacterium]